MFCRLSISDQLVVLTLALFALMAMNKLLAQLWDTRRTARVYMLVGAFSFLVTSALYSMEKHNPLSIAIHTTIALLCLGLGVPLVREQLLHGRNSNNSKGSTNA
jgi:hypothetical protein